MHNLYGTRFVGARQPAWHGLGTVIPEGEDISVEEAVRRGKIDYPIILVPAGYHLPNPDGSESETFIKSDKQIVLRGPTADTPQWDELGVVGSEFQVMQNIDLARGLDAITKQTGWRFETVGALGKGETVFLTLDCGADSIFGDTVRNFLIVSDGKAANRALQIVAAKVRTVCENTLLASDSAALATIRIPHLSGVDDEYQFWLNLIETLQAAHDDAKRELERMASVKISDEQARAIIQDTFPIVQTSRRQRQADDLRKLPGVDPAFLDQLLRTAKPQEEKYVKERELTAALRQESFVLYEKFNEGKEHGVASGGQVVDPETLKQLAGTPYAVLQAVTELIDWGGRAGYKAAGLNATFGRGAEYKGRAWTSARKMAEIAAPVDEDGTTAPAKPARSRKKVTA